MSEIDPRAAAAALDVSLGELADVCRLHAARLLRRASALLEGEGNPRLVLEDAARWLDRGDAAETAWDLDSFPEDDEYEEVEEVEPDSRRADLRDGASSGTEATPLTPDALGRADQKGTR